MYFSFYKLLELCRRTIEVSEKYRFITGGPNKAHIFYVMVYTPALYHIVWCVQNGSLPFRGLPISSRDLSSCESPLFPFNNETIQGSTIVWWRSLESLRTELRMVGSMFIDLIKCAKENIFITADLINSRSIIEACGKITNPNLVLEMKSHQQLQQVINANKARDRQYRMIKPIYVTLGIITFLFGCLGNLIIGVIALGQTMRHTSSGIYMFSFAIIDTFFMCIRIIPQILSFVMGREEELIKNIIICKMSFFFMTYVAHLSAWLRLCFVIERTVAVTLPYIYHVYFSRFITLIILLACCMMLAAANLPVVFFVASNNEHCVYQNVKWSYVLLWIDIVVSTILPFTGIIASNSILIYSLCKARRQRQQ